jgi:6-phosphogluconolactonase (cycloisomerase 2 family)
VNAGSGSVSVFSVHGSQLSLVDRVISGGSEPNAVAQHGNLAYVVNVGGSSNVVGFRLDDGKLKQIPNSTRFLSTNTSGAGGLAFSPDGRFLVVIERLTNDIDVFSVQGDSRNRRGIRRTLLIAAALSVIAPVAIRTGQKEPPPTREAWSSSFFCVKDR